MSDDSNNRNDDQTILHSTELPKRHNPSQEQDTLLDQEEHEYSDDTGSELLEVSGTESQTLANTVSSQAEANSSSAAPESYADERTFDETIDSSPNHVQPSDAPFDSERTEVQSQSTTPTSSNSKDAQISDIPENYEILGELGRGGMGVVYKARHKNLNRLAALKMILSGSHASEQDILRFRAEGKAVAQLTHVGIVQIYEVGEAGGRPFFALEYIDGGSLQQKLNGTPMAPKLAAEMTQELAEAMFYAHERGVLHRDLKPANVLLTPYGKPKITDFGLAKLVGDDSSATGTGAILGTPSYMSPEQAKGETREAGPPADIYSLGAMLYDMLTGRPPFRGLTLLDTLQQVQNTEPVPPRRLQPAIPRDLETICLRCLRKEPEKRYSTARELSEDLSRFLNDEPILARPIGIIEHGWKWAKRHPTVAALISMLFLVTIIGVVAVTILWLEAESARIAAVDGKNKADQQKHLAMVAKEDALRAEADAMRQKKAKEIAFEQSQRSLYISQIGRAQEAFQKGHPSESLDVLNKIAATEGIRMLRDFEWYYLSQRCQSDQQSLRGHVSFIRQIAFSADGSKLATASLDRTIKIWSVPTGKLLTTLAGHKEVIRSLKFSPDGETIVSADDVGKIAFWNVATGEKKADCQGGHCSVNSLSYTRNGQFLGAGLEDGAVEIWDVKTRKKIAVLDTDFGLSTLCFSKDGDILAAAGESQWIKLFDWRSNKEVLSLRGHAQTVTCLDFSDDGKLLASGGADFTVRIWDLEQKNPPRILSAGGETIRSVAFGPGNTKLAAVNVNGTVFVWDLLNPELIPSKLPGNANLVRTVAFSNDGQLLASVRINDLKEDDAESFRIAKGRMIGFAYSPKYNSLIAAVNATKSAENQFLGEVVVSRLSSIKDRVEHKLPAVIACNAQSESGNWQVFGCGDGEVFLFEQESETEPQLLTRLENRPAFLAVSQKLGFVAGCTVDGRLFLWNERTKKLTSPINIPSEMVVSSLAIWDDHESLLIGDSSGDVSEYSTNTGELVAIVHKGDSKITTIYCRNNHIMIGCSNGQIFLGDGKNSQAFKSTHRDRVRSLCMNAKGTRLFSGSEDQSIKIWDTINLQEIITLTAHNGPVIDLSLSEDEETLISGSPEATIRLWRAPRSSP